MRRDHLVEKRDHGLFFLGGPFFAHKTSPSWFDLHLGLQEAASKVDTSINQGLANYRILAFEERGTAVVRLAPSRDFATHPDKKCWYVLTRDLPNTWFQPSIDLKSSRSRALTWLRAAGKLAVKNGMRIARTDGIEVMNKKFGLSKHAAMEVWDEHEHPCKGGQGKIPKGKKVLFDELMAFTV